VHARLKRRTIRRRVEQLLRSWNIGLSLGGGGFTATLQRNPNVDAESVLLRLPELPAALFDRDGIPSLIVFDEIQDVARAGRSQQPRAAADRRSRRSWSSRGATPRGA